jgi:hypothetical protein
MWANVALLQGSLHFCESRTQRERVGISAPDSRSGLELESYRPSSAYAPPPPPTPTQPNSTRGHSPTAFVWTVAAVARCGRLVCANLFLSMRRRRRIFRARLVRLRGARCCIQDCAIGHGRSGLSSGPFSSRLYSLS